MSQPVKLSDELVLDARLAGEAFERSIAGQVEYWAKLGRSIETVIEGAAALALCQRARPLSDCLKSVDRPEGRQRVTDYLKAGPYPQYEPHPTEAGLLIRIDANGARTTGRFVNRRFRVAGTKSAR